MISSFTVAGVRLSPYTLFMIAGAAVFLGLFALITLRRHPDQGDENRFVIEMLILSLAAALPFAILFDALFHFIGSGQWRFGSLTFYGGLLGGLAVFPLLLLLKKGRKIPLYDRMCDLAVCIPAGHCLGRLGCFFGGCCFGKPTDSVFGVVFPAGSLPANYYGGAVSIHPTQLYEALFLLVLAIFLMFFGKKQAFSLYLILYGCGRFLLEFLRGDDRGRIPMAALSPAQGISLLLMVLGTTIMIVRRVRRNKTSQSA